MLSSDLVGSIRFDDVGIVINGLTVAYVSGRAWIDRDGDVAEIDFDAVDPFGNKCECRAIVDFNLSQNHRESPLDDRNILIIANAIKADYADDIGYVMSPFIKRERDPGPSQGQRL
jgi:hypothetical protein